eukprot:3530559-Rhodomonas_salina.1
MLATLTTWPRLPQHAPSAWSRFLLTQPFRFASPPNSLSLLFSLSGSELVPRPRRSASPTSTIKARRCGRRSGGSICTWATTATRATRRRPTCRSAALYGRDAAIYGDDAAKLRDSAPISRGSAAIYGGGAAVSGSGQGISATFGDTAAIFGGGADKVRGRAGADRHDRPRARVGR